MRSENDDNFLHTLFHSKKNNKKQSTHRPGSFPSFEPTSPRRTLTVTSAETNLQVALDVCLGIAKVGGFMTDIFHSGFMSRREPERLQWDLLQMWVWSRNRIYCLDGFMLANDPYFLVDPCFMT